LAAITTKGDERMRFLRALLLTVVLVMTISLALAGPSAARPVPHFSDPNVAGSRLVHNFFTLLQHKNIAGLERFLAPDFQVQRADGSASGKSDYLAALPTVLDFTISDLVATQSGAAIVVRYRAVAEGLVNGKPYTPGPAPRLSVFEWNGTRWQIVAHANFNPLTG
jgi:hypothetical protein